MSGEAQNRSLSCLTWGVPSSLPPPWLLHDVNVSDPFFWSFWELTIFFDSPLQPWRHLQPKPKPREREWKPKPRWPAKSGCWRDPWRTPWSGIVSIWMAFQNSSTLLQVTNPNRNQNNANRNPANNILGGIVNAVSLILSCVSDAMISPRYN